MHTHQQEHRGSFATFVQNKSYKIKLGSGLTVARTTLGGGSGCAASFRPMVWCRADFTLPAPAGSTVIFSRGGAATARYSYNLRTFTADGMLCLFPRLISWKILAASVALGQTRNTSCRICRGSPQARRRPVNPSALSAALSYTSDWPAVERGIRLRT